jgi:hypothetical protein
LEEEAKRWEAQRESDWRNEREMLQRRLEAAQRDIERLSLNDSQLRQSLLEAQNRIIHLQVR